MKASVYDTYVHLENGHYMHFDIVVAQGESYENVLSFGRKYLDEKGKENEPFTSEKCNFCHVEQAPDEMANAIKTNGYHIIEMEGC